MICARNFVTIFWIIFSVTGCEKRAVVVPAKPLESPFSITHLKTQGDPLEESPYPHMWYYRTEIRNTSKRNLRIIWFESYIEVDGVWYPGNALGAVLRPNDFSSWYTEGAPSSNGSLPPGKTVACDPNWHGTPTSAIPSTKWAFIAVDEFGFDYFVESEVPPDIMTHTHDVAPEKRSAFRSSFSP